MAVSFGPDDIDALVFDIGGVFVVPHHEVIGEHLRAAGFAAPLGAERYHRAHHGGVRALCEAGDGHHDEGDPAFWLAYQRAYVRRLGLGEDVEDAAARTMAQLFGGAGPLWHQLVPHNIAAVAQLAATGRPLAIVSNNDGTAERQMVEFGVCQIGPGPLAAVVAVVDSGLVGIRKPDPAIFTPALEALGTAPGRTLYVGDTVHADVLGARAAGLAVVQLDPYDDHAGFDHDRVADLDELVAVLTAG